MPLKYVEMLNYTFFRFLQISPAKKYNKTTVKKGTKVKTPILTIFLFTLTNYSTLRLLRSPIPIITILQNVLESFIKDSELFF